MTTSAPTTLVPTTAPPENYETCFSEYTLLAQPNDWTERWHTAVAAATVRTPAGPSYGNAYLRLDHSSANRYALSWDDVGSSVGMEILYKCSYVSTRFNGMMRGVVRGAGDDTAETGYFIGYEADTEWMVYKYVGGAATKIGSSIAKNAAVSTWYWVRFRVVGTDIKAKVWADGDAEPGWDFEETDSSISAAGWAGLGSYNGDYNHFDWFSAATNGGTALGPGDILGCTTIPPTTLSPTTLVPTTLVPTTLESTTSIPTTASPTTVGPTTIAPTTLVPTTILTTTLVPTTASSTTAPPTTPSPAIEVGWTADKDLGPWAFTEQKDKWGYLNNKRWSDQPAAVAFSTSKGNESDRIDKHVPCGHWHKGNTYNQLYGTGSASYGQLAIDWTEGDQVLFFLLDPMIGWKMVTCGSWYTLAIKLDGIMWGTGNNGSGELGLGHNIWTDRLAQVPGSNWDTVEGGRYHTLALQLDGTIWATGNNAEEQLGIPAIAVDVYSFTQIGIDTDWAAVSTGSGSWSSAALKRNGTLWTWGRNNVGQLGQGDLIIRDVPTQVGADTNWTAVEVGEAHMLALKSNGTLWSTGRNFPGTLGLGDHGIGTNRSVLTQVGVETNWAKIYAGEYYSYAMKADGTIWATGDNDDGQLGQGDNLNLDVFTQVGSLAWDFLACGQSGAHVLAVDDNRNLQSVGRNTHGQLGLGDQIDTNSLSLVNLANIVGSSGGIDHSVVIKESSGGDATDEPQVWNLP